jgi:5-methylcytosine-specific restriction endonuclease McrA
MIKVCPKSPSIKLNREAYAQMRLTVLNRDAWRCQNCGSSENLEVHHKQLRSHSGSDSEENLIALCSYCHSAEHK